MPLIICWIIDIDRRKYKPKTYLQLTRSLFSQMLYWFTSSTYNWSSTYFVINTPQLKLLSRTNFLWHIEVQPFKISLEYYKMWHFKTTSVNNDRATWNDKCGLRRKQLIFIQCRPEKRHLRSFPCVIYFQSRKFPLYFISHWLVCGWKKKNKNIVLNSKLIL